MRVWGVPKTGWIISVCVAGVLTGAVTWLPATRATADCNAEAPADDTVQRIHATKVVVRPWFGQYHVYGIFMVPNRYKPEKKYAATMTVRGFDHRFAVHGSSREQYVDGVVAGPGYYLLRSYVPTRVALWFLINGQFADLRHPCNWTLVFIA